MSQPNQTDRLDSQGLYRHIHEGVEYVFRYHEGALGATLELQYIDDGKPIPLEAVPSDLVRELKSYGYRVVLS